MSVSILYLPLYYLCFVYDCIRTYERNRTVYGLRRRTVRIYDIQYQRDYYRQDEYRAYQDADYAHKMFFAFHLSYLLCSLAFADIFLIISQFYWQIIM